MMVMLNLNLSELTSPSALPAFFSISSSFTVWGKSERDQAAQSEEKVKVKGIKLHSLRKKWKWSSFTVWGKSES